MEGHKVLRKVSCTIDAWKHNGGGAPVDSFCELPAMMRIVMENLRNKVSPGSEIVFLKCYQERDDLKHTEAMSVEWTMKPYEAA
jgi:hypothetical protein